MLDIQRLPPTWIASTPRRVLLAALIGSAAAGSAAPRPAPRAPVADEPGFVNLIADPSLADWVARGGRATYAVEDGVLVGRSVLDSPNSFLCTKKSYADFILELEVLVDPTLNSGIQIRSESRAGYRQGVVHGYQVEIDPSARAWSGGLYDEQRRLWLVSLEKDETAQKAFRNGEWNKYRIEAIGDRIRTWVNGVPTAELVDSMTRTGFIGLQVHSAKAAGLEVRWRNILVKELPPAPTGLFPNTLSDEERKAGWELLWDGKTTWGWRSARAAEFPKEGWEIKDGALSVVESGGGEARAGGDIITSAKYESFELRLEFRITPGANSGIKYYVDPELNKGEGSSIGLEYQILDDERHPDAKLGRDGNRTLASLYDLIPAAGTKKPRPIGDWNEARIVSRGTHVEHWLNGAKVLEYERGSAAFRKRVAESKYEVWPAFGELKEGHVLLQDHGNRVSFRNVKILSYQGTWIDLNKNGQKDPYEDPARPVDQRIEDLLARMTPEEKSCQLATLYGYSRVLKDELPTPEWKQAIWKDGIGNIDEHLNGIYRGSSAKSRLTFPHSLHAESINKVQRFFVEETRLGIPVDFTNEGIRGLCHDRATSFPAQLGVASTWDRELVAEIGRITGREARVLGYTNVYSPILDLPRDPRWGRTAECYSEDPYLTAQLGKIMVRALQKERVVSTPKHYAVYSVPKGGRDGSSRTDPQLTPRELETIYLAPFAAAIRDAGALGVMSSYNDYDGIPITGSSYFLTDILRTRWGFKGYVVSDSKAVEFLEAKHHVAADYPEAVRQAVTAGLDIRTEFTPPDVYIEAVRGLLKDGRLAMAVVDDRVRDVLRVKYWLGLFDEPYVKDPSEADRVVRNPQHLEVALRAAHESIVLLKNDGNALPLRKDLKSILVTGPNAAETESSISRYGPQNIPVVSVLEGIRAKLGPSVRVVHTKGSDFVDGAFPESEILPLPPNAQERAEIDRAAALAREVDAAIVVLGEQEGSAGRPGTVGESRSRTSLELTGFQQRLVEAVHAAGKPTVVVLLNGRPLTINWIDRHVPAVVEAWFQGEHCGTAIADVLFGDVNPSGKLPVTFPRSVGQLPWNFPWKRGSQLATDKLMAEERKNLLNGSLYPFGHGLSYTSFRYSNLAVTPPTQQPAGQVEVALDVLNTGRRAGDEVVQLYLSDEVTSVAYYEQVLRGFERVSLLPGEKKRVRFTLAPEDLMLLDREMRWTVEPGRFEVLLGASSEDIRLRGSFEIR